MGQVRISPNGHWFTKDSYSTAAAGHLGHLGVNSRHAGKSEAGQGFILSKLAGSTTATFHMQLIV